MNQRLVGILLTSTVGAFLGSFFSNNKSKPQLNSSTVSIPDEQLETLMEKLDNVEKSTNSLKTVVANLGERIQKIPNAKPEIVQSNPEISVISEIPMKPISDNLTQFSPVGLLSILKTHFTLGKSVLLCTAAVGCFFIWRFVTRRRIKFFIGDDFKDEMKSAIIQQLTRNTYLKARFELVQNSQADIFVVNGDLSLRNDNIVPKDKNVYLSICKQSECSLAPNEVRIRRSNSTIYLDSGSIQKIFDLLR